MNSLQSQGSGKIFFSALVGCLMGFAGLAGCSQQSVDTPKIANVTVEPDTWSASTDAVDLTLTADVIGFDNAIASVTAQMEGTSFTFNLAKGSDIATGEQWETTQTLTGPFTAGTYNIIFTAKDSEGDSAVSDQDGAQVTITND